MLARVNAVTEVPLDHWDWRLYYDANPKTRDKIYSKWGGFLADMPFDPLLFGMPPNSLPSIEPVQLIALEAVRRALRRRRLRGAAVRPRAHRRHPRRRRRRPAHSALSYSFRSYLPMLATVPGLKDAADILSQAETASAGVDRGFFPRHPHQRHRRPGRQSLQLRRSELLH